MKRLEALTLRGIRASIRLNTILWLEPKFLVTPDVRDMVRVHLDVLMKEIRETAAVSSDDIPVIVPDYHILWVATDLDSFEEYDPRFGYELHCSPVYRMLDASYYAWLRHKMENAKKAHASRVLEDASYDVLRQRFNVIHEWAIRHIGEDSLRRAVRTMNVQRYVPPSDETYEAYQRTWSAAWEASKDQTPKLTARQKVDDIKDEALVLGWTEESLYNTQGKFRYPLGKDWGLIRSLGGNAKVDNVTRQYVELTKTHPGPNGTVTRVTLRHFNPNVEQPWMKRVTASA